MRPILRFVTAGVLAALLGAAPLSRVHAQTAPASDVLVFAAASLQTALDALTPQIEKATGAHLKASYAASSALARQIENAAPADIFISADLDWMDYVAARHLIQPATRVNLLGNQLVLIAPADKAVSLKIGPNFALAQTLGADRLAVADPASVPAGKYAKAALTSLGVWDSVANQLASAENVRAALLLVSRGEAPLGIVYQTDAAADPNVRIVGAFPEDTHPKIIYPVALTASTKNPDAAGFLAYVKSAKAKPLFEKQGFTVLMPPGRV
jgi:molybdate transport system substrate-binding protein